MLPVLVVPSPRPRRHFGAAAGGVHPIISLLSRHCGTRRLKPGSFNALSKCRLCFLDIDSRSCEISDQREDNEGKRDADETVAPAQPAKAGLLTHPVSE